MRAPGSNAHAFVFQSFLDEVAHAAGKDPLQHLIDLYAEERAAPPPASAAPKGPPGPRWRRRLPDGSAVQRQRAQACWSRSARPPAGASASLPAGTGMGVAFYYSHLGYFAEVVQATVAPEDGSVEVDKVWVVGDVGGVIINPTGALNQCQGAVIDGISQALAQKITIDRGRVAQTFPEYPLLRIYQAPQVQVDFRSRPFRRRAWANRPCRRSSRRCAMRSSPPRASASATCPSIRRC